MTGRERLVDDVGHGDHLCLAFDDDAEQRRVATRYVADGLRRGERVLYLLDRDSPDTVREWLRAAAADVPAALASGQLRVAAWDGSSVSGRFDAEAMIGTLRRELHESLDAGYTGLRVSGEMAWALRGVPDAAQIRRYETKVTEVFSASRASAVCQYDARLLDADQLAAVDLCHPLAVELAPLRSTGTLRIVPAFQAGQRTLRVVGSVDHHTVDQFAEALRDACARPGDLRVDMGDLEFIDLAGLRILARTAESLDAGRRLLITGLAPMLCRVIRIAGLARSPALVLPDEEEPAP